MSAKSVNSTAVRVSWVQPNDPNGEISYKLSYRKSNKPPSADIDVYHGTDTQYTVAGLEEYVLYHFTVVAFNRIHEDWISPSAFAVETTHPAGRVSLRLC